MRFAAALAVLVLPVQGQALDLSLPGKATLVREVDRAAESYLLPTGPFAEGAVPAIEVEGQFLQQAWRLEAQAITTLQMVEPLRVQLAKEGYEILLDCRGPECGGFDFRFATRVMPAPDMFVDLQDYRFLSARRKVEDGVPDYLTVLASRAGETGYIQLIQVAPRGASRLSVDDGAALPRVLPRARGDQPVAKALLDEGHVILPDLAFASGSSELGEGEYASLGELATFLKADTTLRVALVGHTDAVGALDPNIALSKRRARSVRQRLIEVHGVAASQLDAEGMGYLAPIAPNLTPEGRDMNRRVEAVLLNSE